jgi:hypothetical protein
MLTGHQAPLRIPWLAFWLSGGEVVLPVRDEQSVADF